VIVYDPDGLNPYGRELAVLLGGRALTAHDAEWLPPGTRNLLPANRSRPGRLLQAARLLHGLLVCLGAALRRETVVVVLTRSVLDEMGLALVALLGRVVLVVHDPVPKQPPPTARRLSYGLLLRAARTRVTHSADLAAQVPGGARVVRHLPYAAWCAALSAYSAGAGGLLALGQLRPDKGMDRLAAALRGVPRTSLVVCGKGPLDPALRAALAEVADVDDRAGDGFAPDAEVARALRETRVLVAPYRQVSQSGTAALAATAGLAVVAYDSGAVGTLPGVVTVPDGDAAAFAAAVTAALAAPARVDVAAWERDAAADWRAALG
jgi:glycosyltransferase involved in cell wall biosynthesis